jgi:hypothetical protein
LFKCYTGCDNSTFDIFELVIKVANIQWNKQLDLNDAVRWIAAQFNITGTYETSPEEQQLEDWKYLSNYERIQGIETATNDIILKEYDDIILSRFNYNVIITPWIKDGIAREVMSKAQIGFYPGGEQITIPHFDKNGRFIGLRGRTLGIEEGERFGKYRPIKVNGLLYNHPLGMNLYGLNWSKDNIKSVKKAIIFESEKAVLQYASYFGWDNNISVACCGSSISTIQMNQLIQAGAQEVIIGFDRQFLEIGDDEFKRLKSNLLKIREKYKSYVLISFMFDKNKITGYKSSPTDEGVDKFLQLFKERIVL